VNEKILTRDQLKRRVEKWRKSGEKITLANGCFDVLHVGHVRYVKAAKELGGKLIVAVNSDDSVRGLKGEGRPHMPENERAEILNTLLHKYPMLTPVESALALDGSAAEVIVFRIKIERLTGVSEG